MKVAVHPAGPADSGQGEDVRDLIKLNFQRMKRVYKTTVIHEELRDLALKVPHKLIWLVITDMRCGDSSQSIPVMQRISEINGNIRLKIIFREGHPQIMDAFLTNGTRAIPKLICMDSDTLNVLGTWGPRPEPLQNMLLEHKNNPVLSKAEFSEMIQRKYLRDKTKTIQKELLKLLHSCLRQNNHLLLN